jgi:hypothetical protein
MATKNLIPGFDPNRGNNYTMRPDTPAAKTGGNGSNGSNSNAAAAPPADPDASDPSRGFDVGPVHFGFTNRGTPGVSYPGSQAIHDWQNRATNNMSLNLGDPLTAAAGGPDLATLRAQRDAVNQRMGPVAKTTADIVGQANPTQLLNAVPFAGPALQGATQEGIRSYAAGRDWPTIRADTAMGGAGGAVAGTFNTPKAIGQALGKATEVGVPAAVGYLTGGESAVEHGLIGGVLGSKFFEPAGKAVEGVGERLNELAGPNTKAALQNLLMGGASSFIQNNPQPPPMPFFGYPGN